MTEESTSQESPRLGPLPENTKSYLQSIAIVFSHSNVYGFSHAVTKQSVKTSYELLCKVLGEQQALNLAVSEDDLLVDRRPYENPTPAIRSFGRHLLARNP